MGVFDIVYVPCPKCGRRNEAQSKGSDRAALHRFDLDKAPLDVLSDVNRHAPFTCVCGCRFEVKMEISTRVVEAE